MEVIGFCMGAVFSLFFFYADCKLVSGLLGQKFKETVKDPYKDTHIERHAQHTSSFWEPVVACDGCHAPPTGSSGTRSPPTPTPTPTPTALRYCWAIVCDIETTFTETFHISGNCLEPDLLFTIFFSPNGSTSEFRQLGGPGN